MSDKYKDIKISTPVSLIIYGGNILGFNLAKTLMEQGGRVIIIDNFNSQTKKYITALKKLGHADFIDFKGIESLYKRLSRIDYVFYLLNNKLIVNNTFTSKDFLDESNVLNLSLKTAQKYSSKVSLVTSIQLNQELSAHILDKNLSSPSPYSSIELQKYCETLAAEYRDKSNLDIRIIRLGTLLGKDLIEITDETIKNLIIESVNKGYITIEGDGLNLHYLINIVDSIYGLLKLTFNSKTNGEVISLCNNQDYTTLSIAYKLLEINPEIEQIKFAPNNTKKQLSLESYIPAPNAEIFGWHQVVQIEETLIDTISSIFPKTGQIIAKREKVKEVKKSPEIRKSISIKTPLGNFLDKISRPILVSTRKVANIIERFKQDLSPKSILRYVIIFSLAITTFYYILSPLIGIAIGTYLAYINGKSAFTSLSSFEFTKAENSLKQSNLYIDRIGNSFNKLKWGFYISGNEDLFNNTSQLIFGTKYATIGAIDIVNGMKPVGEYIRDFEPALDFDTTLPSSNREYRDYLVKLKANTSLIEKGAYNLQQAYTLIDSTDLSVFPKFSHSSLLKIKDLNDELQEVIIPIQKIVTFAPDLLGVNERMRYLILLQNSAELRSTGGWISSYALLSIEGGQIRELKVDDVYNIDGQIKTTNKEIKPPTDLTSALDTESWGLSLVNWYPDLSDVIDNAEYLINIVDPGTQFDGIITIDTEFLKKLLHQWNGLSVPGEVEKITENNLDEKIFEIHKGFEPGSNIKSTFLANLANVSLQKLLSSSLSDFGKTGNTIFNSLNQKHILVYFKNTNAYSYFKSQRWTGALETQYLSSTIPIEWNWGGNKANLYIERSHNLNVDIIDKTEIQYNYSLAIQNNSTSKVYPQGDYTNYLRLFLPENAEINTVKGFTNDTNQIYTQGGFKVIGGFFNVPIQTTKVFEISYTLNKDEGQYFPLNETLNALEYTLTVFKQPGTSETDSLQIALSYPDNWASVNSGGLDKFINQLTKQTDLDTDKQYRLTWEYK